jgi:hypothetical protein
MLQVRPLPLNSWNLKGSGNVLVLYSEGNRFESRPAYRLHSLKHIVVFLSLSRWMLGNNLKQYILLKPYVLIVYYAIHISMLYVEKGDELTKK